MKPGIVHPRIFFFCLQIELDLLRTLPNNKHYETRSAEGVPKLRRVLLAYTQHNPEIGYCQVLKVYLDLTQPHTHTLESKSCRTICGVRLAFC